MEAKLQNFMGIARRLKAKFGLQPVSVQIRRGDGVCYYTPEGIMLAQEAPLEEWIHELGHWVLAETVDSNLGFLQLVDEPETLRVASENVWAIRLAQDVFVDVFLVRELGQEYVDLFGREFLAADLDRARTPMPAHCLRAWVGYWRILAGVNAGQVDPTAVHLLELAQVPELVRLVRALVTLGLRPELEAGRFRFRGEQVPDVVRADPYARFSKLEMD